MQCEKCGVLPVRPQILHPAAMSISRVYLGRIDIDRNSEIDLFTDRGRATHKDITRYLFLYALVADEVFMQGSAALKNLDVFAAFKSLQEAFFRNEHYEPKPIFNFVLNEHAEDYTDYISKRLDFLQSRGRSNAERVAYETNDARGTARSLDSYLSCTPVPRRINSVAKAFRKGLKDSLLTYQETKLSDSTCKSLLRVVESEDEIQTFSLMQAVRRKSIVQQNSAYLFCREKYRRANAFGSLASESDAMCVYNINNVSRFVHFISQGQILLRHESLNATWLMKQRALKSFRELRDFYLESQSQEEIERFLLLVKSFFLKGKFRILCKHSPAALVTYLCEWLASNSGSGVGWKTFEYAARSFVNQWVEEAFVKRCFTIFRALEQIETDLKG